MKIGLFFGSFNPIHNGHIALARYLLKNEQINEIWLVVSPQNPLKKVVELWDDDFRLHLAEIAVQRESQIRVCDIEFNMPKPSYTIDTLRLLQQKYPENQFILIIGSDNAETFGYWRCNQQIIDNFEVWAYPRDGYPSQSTMFPQIRFIDAPLYNLSATEIRQYIALHQPISHLVPSVVEQKINEHFGI